MTTRTLSQRQTLANAIRVLAMDTVQKANSGHPGAPMGMADIAESLWNGFYRHNPSNPNWFDRDRFILSNGHGSVLQYALLHLTGYDLSIEDLKSFRQLHSKTPGHPEYGYAPGIETTTGPLGQGITNAVGFALAEKLLADEFNQTDHAIINHHTYVFLGDGCLMEGISHEACSLAGTLGLGKLIAFYDDNGISIDGEVEGWFTDDTPKRFEAYGWQVISVDGHDFTALDAAITAAKEEAGKPTLICCKTIIGKGSPNKQGTESCHGAPLGTAEIELTRANLGWTLPAFEIPADVYAAWDAKTKGAALEAEWNARFAAYQVAYPAKAAELARRMAGQLPSDWDARVADAIAHVENKAETIASRKASQNAIEALAPTLPELVGGSADLAGSNLTLWSGSTGVSRENGGNYVYYGVREFAMTAIMNGMVLHGGVRTYGATFLMFSEYARNALRMAALMKINPVFVFTHDSIGLGEDGPTHQPVEQTATLRLIPNMDTWRPCDTTESLVAWAVALEQTSKPSNLIFSRQNLPFQTRSAEQTANIRKGAYVLADFAGISEKKVVLIATGSEVGLAQQARTTLAAQGIDARVVSMPCTSIFDAQDNAYKTSVLPQGIKRIAIEAGIRDYWYKYVGFEGAIIGMDTFGESAPAADLYQHFGITVEAIIDTARNLV